MSFFRYVLLVGLISLSAALGLLFYSSKIGYEEFQGGYAVLSTDASVDDRALLSYLEAGADLFGGAPVSESSQVIFLNEFDSLQMVPLDVYFDRLFYFDPRNDGYAQKLKDIFIRGSQRYVFLPLKAGNWNSNLLNKQFNELFPDIHFSVDYYRIGHPVNIFFLSFAAASLCLLVICLIKRKKTSNLSSLIFLIPLLSSLAFFGAPGIAYAALFFTFFTLLKNLLNEIVISAGSSSGKNIKNIKGFLKEYILPYIFYWIFLVLFTAALIITAVFSQINKIFLLSFTCAAVIVFLFSEKILSRSHNEHRRFVPVSIVKRNNQSFVFSVYMLPLTAAAFFILFFASYMPASYDTDGQFDTFVNEQDYYDHLNYQFSFSKRQIGAQSAVFPGFFFDNDNLISMEIITEDAFSVNLESYPPFPLNDLMDFFHNVNSGRRMDLSYDTPVDFSRPRTALITENLIYIILVLFILSGLFIKRKINYPSKIIFLNLKRTIQGDLQSGKSRIKGINWNKKPLYNSRNIVRIRKDA